MTRNINCVNEGVFLMKLSNTEARKAYCLRISKVCKIKMIVNVLTNMFFNQ